MSKDEQIHSLKQENEQLKQQVDQLQRALFGQRSERRIVQPLDESQLSLLLDDQTTEQVNSETTEVHYIRKKANKPVRKPIPDHLPRVREELDPQGVDLSQAIVIGEEKTEVLEIEPSKLFVRQIIRRKYRMANGEIIIAPLPKDLPLSRSNASSSILSHILVAKFVDHIPFYRWLKQLNRSDIYLAESTLNGWIKQTVQLLEVLYEKLQQTIIKQNYLQADESTIRVLESKKTKTHRGYMWVYHAPMARMVLFEYHKGRGQEVPKCFLKSFKGCLQTDGYKAYNIFEHKDEIQLLACWAHARRKFYEAQKNDKKRADYALNKIALLYKLEKEAKEKKWPIPLIEQKREIQAKPLIDELVQWAQQEYPKTLPKSPIGNAISYLLSLADRLTVYCQKGELCIDNNPIERHIRPLALGRKNYLFAGNHESAKWAAMFYSFFQTCQANELNPYKWLKEVLEKINDQPVNRVHELLPLKENFS